MESRLDLHERLSRDEEVKGPSDRGFGLTFAGVFAFLAAWSAWRGGMAWPALLGLSAVFLGFAGFAPRLLQPLNHLWMRFARALHAIVNPVVMSVLFFVVITPVGIAARWAGKDFLRLRFEPDGASYWLDRRPPGPDPQTMRNQF